ncbi:MAG: DNA-processing protein DprA [Gemmatimonadaceae bacterium]
MGPVRWRRLVDTHTSAHAALLALAGEFGLNSTLERARFLRAECDARGVRVMMIDDVEYPKRALALEDAPNPLFFIGKHATLSDAPTVALVGARHATSAGRNTSYRFAAALARAGVCVISGLAAGVDAEAHAGALSAGGATVAVLGTGVDVPYPIANTALHASIAREGLIVSESPPGRAAFAGAFPRRNRIIAAFADVVVVVEAGMRSGALITAQLGDTLGRLIAAVPGPIDSSFCAGSNQLLRDGAHVVTSAEDVLAMLSLVPKRDVDSTTRTSNDGDSETSVSHKPLQIDGQPSHEALGSVANRRTSLPIAIRRRKAISSVSTAPAFLDALDQRAAVALAGVDVALGGTVTPELRILEVLAAGPQYSDDLVRAAHSGAREVGIALSLLTLAGLIVVDASGLVRRR